MFYNLETATYFPYNTTDYEYNVTGTDILMINDRK